MKDYTVMTLAFISRLALLENADKTRGAVDDLVKVLRYMQHADEEISTVTEELKIIERMFRLNKLRKGPAFNFIVNSGLGEDRVYLSKGLLVALVDLAMNKDLHRGKTSLEIIVSVREREGQVEVVIKDNASTDHSRGPEDSLETAYNALSKAYEGRHEEIAWAIKPGIGSKVVVTLNR